MRAKIFLVFLGLLGAPQVSRAQCAMCRAVVESGADGKTAEAINNGIVYLMVVPYVLVTALIYFVYRQMRSRNFAEKSDIF